MTRAGQQRAVGGLPQGEDVGAVQARALLRPAQAAIGAGEDTARRLVVDDPEVEVAGIGTVLRDG